MWTITLGARISSVFDFVVVGLGAFGSAATRRLAQLGHHVLGIDRFAPPHALGSSHGDTRLYREAPYYGSYYWPLLEASHQRWRELEEEGDRALLHPSKALLLGRSDCDSLRGHLASLRARPDRFEELSPDEVRARFPSFMTTPETVAVLESRAGILSPEACIQVTLDSARAAGAELRTDEHVLSWGIDDGPRVRTSRGEVRARRLVLAAGAWTPKLVPEIDLPVQVERTVQYWLEPSDAVANRFDAEQCPAWVWEHEPGASWYGFPRTERGVKLGVHRGTGRQTDPSGIDRAVGKEEERSMRGVLERFMPDALGRRADASVCMYSTTPDEAPILDRHPDHAAVTIFTGGSGHCFKFAPVFGELLAGLADDSPASYDLSPFRIDRF